MRRIDPIEHIRKNRDMYLPVGIPLGGALAERLVFDAMLLGAHRVEAAERAGWWVVSSDHDWLAGATDPVELFRRVIPFPAAGVNAMRSEVLVTAFAECIGIATPDSFAVVVDAENETPAFRAEHVRHDWARREVFFKVRKSLRTGEVVETAFEEVHS